MTRRRLPRKKTLSISLAIVVILLGAALGTQRLLDAVLQRYPDQLVARVEERIGHQVTVDRLSLGWNWAGLGLRMEGVTVLAAGGQQPAIHLQSATLRFSFWDFLRGSLLPDTLILVAPWLVVERDPDSGLRIRGIASAGTNGIALAEVAAFLEPVERIEVHRAAVGYIGPRVADTLWLRDVGVTLTSHASRLHLRANVRLPSQWGDTLQAELTVHGPLGKPRQLELHARVQGEKLAVPRLLALFGLGGEDLQGGRAQVAVTVDWRQQRLAEAHLEWSSAPLHLRSDGDHAASPLAPGVALTARAQSTADGYLAKLLSLRVNGEPVPSTGTLRLHTGCRRPATQSGEKCALDGHLAAVPAAFVGALARVAFPERLRGVQADGLFTRIDLQADRGAGPRVRAEFRDLRLRHAGTGLSLGGFDGRGRWSAEGASVELETDHGALVWPRYLTGTLAIDALQAAITWDGRRGADALRFENLHLVLGATAISGAGLLQFPEDAPVRADLALRGHSGDIGPLLAHLPQGADLPFERLRAWLSRALPRGRISAASLRLQGPLDEFPFADGGGIFRVRMQGAGVTLNYWPGWPELHQITGQFALTGDTVEITAKSAEMLGVALGPVHAQVANVRKPILTVSGQAPKAPAARLLRFLAASPLKEKFGRLVEVLQLEGLASLDLNLVIPLKRELGERAVNGSVQLFGVDLDHAALPAPIRRISGALNFDLHALYADDLRALFLGMPVLADLAPAPGGAVAVGAELFLDLPKNADALDQIVPAALLKRARGKSAWQVDFTVSPRGGVSDLVLASDLRWTALDLPAPLAKPFSEATPTTLRVATDRSRVQVDYGDRLALDLRFRDKALYAIDATFGGVVTTPPAGAGLWVGGHIPVIDVPAWRRLLADFRDRGGGDGRPGLGLRGANLAAGSVRVDGQRIPALSVVAQPWNDKGWEARFSGKGAAGTVRWILRPGRRPLLWARLQHLVIVSADAQAPGDARTSDHGIIDPGVLPALDTRIKNLRVEGRGLGRLVLVAAPLAGGVHLKRLLVEGNRMHFHAQGRWLRVDGKSSAELTARLHGSGMADLLVALGYEPNLRARLAKFETELRFAPRAEGLQPGALNGSLHLKLKDGTLVPVDPGAVRVLGLLNLYALPRRLLFDFSDVLDKGLAFDSLTGGFRIDDGVAHTDSLRIDTPFAAIRIDGSISLDARRYDQRVTVEPKLSTPAAIAGAVLGGPVVGAVIFLVQRLFHEPFSEITSVTYRVTGSWDNPRVEPVSSQTE